MQILKTSLLMLKYESRLVKLRNELGVSAQKSMTLLSGKYFNFPTVVSSTLASDNVERARRMWQPSGVRASSLVIIVPVEPENPL